MEAGGRPFSPAPTRRIRSVSLTNESRNELQWSRSCERRIFSPHSAARSPQTPEQILDLLVARYGMNEVADILRPLLTEPS